MLQFLRTHLVRLAVYYAIFYAASIMIPFCPCDNKLNNWANEQRQALITNMKESKKENNLAGKFSKFILELFNIK